MRTLAIVYVDENDDIVGSEQDIIQSLIYDILDYQGIDNPTDQQYAYAEQQAVERFDDMVELGVLTEKGVDLCTQID